MGKKENIQGHNAEKNQEIHDLVCRVLGFHEVWETSKPERHLTKADNLGRKTPTSSITGISIKSPAKSHLQVLLSTAKQVSILLDLTIEEYLTFEMWLGTNNPIKYAGWKGKFVGANDAHGAKYMRGRAGILPDWDGFLGKLNRATKNKTLLVRLFQSLEGDAYCCEYLAWFNKSTRIIRIVDYKILIDYISKNCEWVLSDSKTGEFNLWCVDQCGNKLLSLQSKGSRIKKGKEKGGLHRGPMFHLYHEWPQICLLHTSYLDIELSAGHEKTIVEEKTEGTLLQFMIPKKTASSWVQRKREQDLEMDRVYNSPFEDETTE